MNYVDYDSHFSRAVSKLSRKQQEKLSRLIAIMKLDAFDSRLHTKNLHGKFSGHFSFRITRDWRVIFQFLSSNKIQLLEVAHRKDIYKSL